ncbi:MAG: hypothetical protein ACI4AQ_02805 [Lachnospiraceae bacterium]
MDHTKKSSLKERMKQLPVNRYIDLGILVFLLVFPLFSNTYWLYVMSGIMAYIIFALSLDLLWGYTGLMSMGHSLLFGAGGYMIGISCSYLNQADWVNYDHLPWFLAPLSSELGAFIMALAVPALISLIIGFFMFSGKIQGTFFALITLALSGVAELFVINQSKYTHGNSGISLTSRTLISNAKSSRMSDLGFYFVILVFLVLCYALCMLIVHSRLGKILQAIRENEFRLVFFGYKPAAFKMLIYTICGAMAGLAGVLYVRVQGSVNSTAVGINLATLVLVWVAVGGRGNLTGAMVGTLVLQIAETVLNSVFSGISSDFAQYWKLVLGIIILLIVFLLPKGIVGSIIDSQQKAKDQKRKDAILAKEE